MADVMKFTDDNFEQNVLQSSEPVLVDFWAVWCGPCRAIAPSVEAVSQEYSGKARVGKLDIDENPRVAATYGIRSIPTLLIFKEGKVVEQIVGAVPKQTIVNALNNHLSPAAVA